MENTEKPRKAPKELSIAYIVEKGRADAREVEIRTRVAKELLAYEKRIPKPAPAETPGTGTGTAPKPFAGLLMELNDGQLDKLFEILTTGYKCTIKNGSGELKELTKKIKHLHTDINSFKYVFGGKDKPANFQPIKFLESKQILRQILTELQKEKKFNKRHPETRELSNEIERQTPIFFIDDKNEPFKLANNDSRKSNPELIQYILASIF